MAAGEMMYMNVRSIAPVLAVSFQLLLSACQTTGDTVEGIADGRALAEKVGADTNLYLAVEEHVRSQGSNLSKIPHQISYTDLNDDGLLDVILLVNAREWCIGESCTLMVFEGTESGAKMLSELTLISSPVSIGDLVAEGQWRDIFVTLPGTAGGASMARIAYNGTAYPEAPSEWDFLVGYNDLPGRAVLVGGGVAGSELEDFDKLLASVTPPSADALDLDSLPADPVVVEAPAVDTLAVGTDAESDVTGTITDTVETVVAPGEITLAAAEAAILGVETAAPDVALVAELSQAVTSLPAPKAPVAPSMNNRDKYFGRYSWGPGEAYFRPCGGESVFWVTANEELTGELDKSYRQIASRWFDDVYLEAVATEVPKPEEGSASFFDGVLDINAIRQMKKLDAEACSDAQI